MQYLHTPSARTAATNVFTIPSNDVIRKFIRRLVTRLEQAEEPATSTNTTTTDNDESSTPSQSADNPATQSSVMTMEQQLELAMRQSVASTSTGSGGEQSHPTRDRDKKLDAAIKAEMAVYESTGKRGRSLEEAYHYLLTIPPTSVEAERAFSAAGVLCNKLRNRLDDATLDTLCFLRSYFRKP